MGESSSIIPETVLLCDRGIRDQWPVPQACRWREAYPSVFDDDDLRLALSQKRNHFGEWFVAVHLFQTLGAVSVVEKYLFRNHPRKAERLRDILSSGELTSLRSICDKLKIQPPDLLIHLPATGRFWFAEVKRPGEKISPKQQQSHGLIASELHTQVEIYRVKVAHAS